MIEIPFTDQIQALPDQWGDPKVIAAGAAIGATLIAIDVVKQRKVAGMNAEYEASGIPLADPELALANDESIKSTNRVERVGTYAALGMAVFGALHLAGPTLENTKAHGGVTVVVDASYRADAADMENKQTRLAASVAGAIGAAESRDVSMSFMLSGTTASVVATTDGREVNAGRIYTEINDELAKNSYRNGESIASGVTQSQALGVNGETNKTIILSANPGAGSEIGKIAAIADQTDSVYAIVTGTSEGSYTVAGTKLPSNIDEKGFSRLLGADRVQTADSAEQVQQEIEKIIDVTVLQKESQPYTLFGKAALLFGAATGLNVATRRGSGIISFRKRK